MGSKSAVGEPKLISRIGTPFADFMLMWLGGCQHCGRQEQQGREDQVGGC